MEYIITSMKELDSEENEGSDVEVTADAPCYCGEVGCGQYRATVRMPITNAEGMLMNGKLLVTVDKPGFIGWLKRTVLSW